MSKRRGWRRWSGEERVIVRQASRMTGKEGSRCSTSGSKGRQVCLARRSCKGWCVHAAQCNAAAAPNPSPSIIHDMRPRLTSRSRIPDSTCAELLTRPATRRAVKLHLCQKLQPWSAAAELLSRLSECQWPLILRSHRLLRMANTYNREQSTRMLHWCGQQHTDKPIAQLVPLSRDQGNRICIQYLAVAYAPSVAVLIHHRP